MGSRKGSRREILFCKRRLFLWMIIFGGVCSTAVFFLQLDWNIAPRVVRRLKQHLVATEISESIKTSALHDTGIHSCTEVQHIAFVKVHKAGSTTVMNIYQRFAYKRNLLIALPDSYNELSFGLSNVVKIPANKTFDMLINHTPFYNRTLFAKFLPNDTRYIGIVRDPLEVAISAFEYYDKKYDHYNYLKGTNKLMTYLHNREMYEPRRNGGSYTNNRMSYDFGLKTENFHNRGVIRAFLNNLDAEMDIVLILEHFAESLVLLKRKFCWQLKDILYITRNKNGRKESPKFTHEEMVYHRNYSFADYMLYDFFVDRFKMHVANAGNDFQQEVDLFKSLVEAVSPYCQFIQKQKFELRNSSLLTFNASKFNNAFNVTPDDCQLMLFDERSFCIFSRAIQSYILSKHTRQSYTNTHKNGQK